MRKADSQKLNSERYTKAKINQFDQFWELECPNCGIKIDLEVLVDLLNKKKRGKK